MKNSADEIICFLIDDDIDDREVFMYALEAVNPAIRCITACNGREALNLLGKADIYPDLIFLDLNMPLMNGEQFLKEVQHCERLKKIPIIILSTSSNPKTVSETRKLGAKLFITKPDKVSILEKKLKDILTGNLIQ